MNTDEWKTSVVSQCSAHSAVIGKSRCPNVQVFLPGFRLSHNSASAHTYGVMGSVYFNKM